MAKTKKKVNKRGVVGDSIGKRLQMVNRNPMLRSIASAYRAELSVLRENIFDKAIELEDSIIEEVQRELVENTDVYSRFIDLARDTSDVNYIKVLGLAVLGTTEDGELNRSVNIRLFELVSEIEDSWRVKLRSMNGLNLLPTSVVSHITRQYNKTKDSGLYLIKNMIQAEIYKVCQEYLGYTENKAVELTMSEEVIGNTDVRDSVDKTDYTFVDRSWKELNSLAVEHCFSLVRTKGDHGIFRHTNGNIVVIPQGRVIGKGLQIAIVKQLKYRED